MQKLKKSLLATSIAAAMLASIALPIEAAEVHWTGAASEDWFDGLNWDGGVPDTDDDAVLDSVIPRSTGIVNGNIATVNTVTIGGATAGEFTILNGTLNSNNGGVIGAQATSIGQVTISGPSSKWDNVVGSLVVGDAGIGILNVRDGGQVLSDGASIGDEAGSLGVATIDGQNSIWTDDDLLIVGRAGDGVLSILNGAQLNGSSAIIGDQAGSVGTVVVNGLNGTAIWNNTGALVVGAQGQGSLEVLNGGVVDSNSATIGESTGSIGTAMVSGEGSLWDTGALSVGFGGNGTLTIKDGGGVDSGAADIGQDFDSHGTVSVENSGRWNIGGDLFVGTTGSGALRVNDARVSSLSAVIGDGAVAIGEVTVENGGLWENNGALIVGALGTGKLTIDSGGEVLSALASIGSLAGSNGTITVKNGSFLSTELLAIGDEGEGSLDIRSGSQVHSSEGIVAGEDNTLGTVTVDGQGSLAGWIIGGELTVGNFGTGKLSILNGGQVTNSNGAIADENDSTGMVVVEGQGSSWQNANALIIGERGAGSLKISGGGNVRANGNAFVGHIVGSVGTALVDGPGSGWIVNGAGGLQVGGEGSGTLTVSNDGLVRAAAGVSFGQAAASETAINIGAAVGQTAVGAGILDTPTLAFGNGTGTLNFNHTDTAYVFGAAIGGIGQIAVLSGYTTFTADSTAFGGGTSIQGGTLAVDGALGGGIAILSGGRLEGTGTVGDTVVAGGTVAPGHSIGTLTVAGDYLQQAGSTYAAEIDAAGRSDRIVVSGTAQLAGTLALQGEASPIGATYTLLTAGNITGQFTLSNNALATPFLNFALRYDPNAVFLDVTRSSLAFASLGNTRNQLATGAALDRLAANSPLLNAIAGLNLLTASAALDQLSGELHASTRGALLKEGRLVREAAGQRLRAAHGETGRGAWVQMYGTAGSTDHDGNAAERDTGNGGILLGADMAFGESRLGVFGGTGRTSVQVDERDSKADSDSLHFGIYGSASWGAWSLRTGVAYSQHDVETQRHVAFGGLNQQLHANYDARATQGFVETAYRLDTANASYEPYLNVAQVSVRNDPYQETGGSTALRGDKEDTDSGFATLGLRAISGFMLGQTAAKLHGSLGWRHSFGDALPLSHHAFADGDAFVIAGSPIAEDAAVVNVRLDLQLSERATLGLGYSGEFGDGTRENSVQAQLQARF